MSFQSTRGRRESGIPCSLKTFFIGSAFLFLVSCSTEIEKDFDFELNEIESIKEFDYQNEPYYKSLVLTPQHYHSKASGEIQEVTCGFIYKDKEASIKIVVDYETDRIRFESIGEKSDYFVFAISELYEEPLSNPKMKSGFECSFYDGEPVDRSFLNAQQSYKVGYEPNPDTGRGFVQMSLTLFMSYKGITLGEKNSGLAKANFVAAFSE